MLNQVLHIVVLVNPVLTNLQVPEQVIAHVLLPDMLNTLRDNARNLVSKFMLFQSTVFLLVHQSVQWIRFQQLLKFDSSSTHMGENTCFSKVGILVTVKEILSDSHVENAANLALIDGSEQLLFDLFTESVTSNHYLV